MVDHPDKEVVVVRRVTERLASIDFESSASSLESYRLSFSRICFTLQEQKASRDEHNNRKFLTQNPLLMTESPTKCFVPIVSRSIGIEVGKRPMVSRSESF